MRSAADLEALDRIESLLLEMEDTPPGGAAEQVHMLFRVVHSLKGSLKMAGDDRAAAQAHALETALDAVRSRRRTSDRALVDQGLALVDDLRRGTSAPVRPGAEPDPGPDVPAAPGAPAEADGPLPVPVAGIGMDLSAGEQAAIREAAVAGERVYLLEKLLSGDLSRDAFHALPVLEDVARIGRPIAQRPISYVTFRQSLRDDETILRLVFSTPMSRDDLFLELFDPLTELSVEPSEPVLSQPAAHRTAPVPRNGMPLRILVVDDELSSRHLVESWLAAHGEVVPAESGSEALELCQQAIDEGKPFGLILLDLMMPNLNGQVVLRRVRQMEHAAGARARDRAHIAIMSASQDGEHVLSAFAGEADAFLTKPLRPEELELLAATCNPEPDPLCCGQDQKPHVCEQSGTLFPERHSS